MAKEATGDADLLKMLKMFKISAEGNQSAKQKMVAKEIKKINARLAKGGKAMAKGGMPMVKKDGKKVPAFAADGVGKMMKGGMPKKKPAAKMMAGGMSKKSGYMYGGMAKKKPAAKKK